MEVIGRADFRKPCKWLFIEDGYYWKTGCGNVFISGSLDWTEETYFPPCPFCGSPIEVEVKNEG